VTRYLSLAEFWYLAEYVTGINAATLIKASRVELADSALHAPQAGFGDTDFYPDGYDKAAVLACRIAWNHPLPDGNKRAAWACLALFIDLNDGSWNDERPDVDDAVEAMLAVAAREVDENWLADWLRDRVTFPSLNQEAAR
jgi:death-on-curing protein